MNNQSHDQYYKYMQTRYPILQIDQSFFNIPSFQVTCDKSISPVAVRTLKGNKYNPLVSEYYSVRKHPY
ncbi:unnamed protein product [Paramecium sonneborni]|uniref:Uncharacterized protein n=1 Tax=Paramecium sonneborni TaxID=65129 RepID=A0A8S1NHR2_9CILI|nr:unnamed protein product [Paramecium sonneborni]